MHGYVIHFHYDCGWCFFVLLFCWTEGVTPKQKLSSLFQFILFFFTCKFCCLFCRARTLHTNIFMHFFPWAGNGNSRLDLSWVKTKRTKKNITEKLNKNEIRMKMTECLVQENCEDKTENMLIFWQHKKHNVKVSWCSFLVDSSQTFLYFNVKN